MYFFLIIKSLEWEKLKMECRGGREGSKAIENI